MASIGKKNFRIASIIFLSFILGMITSVYAIETIQSRADAMLVSIRDNAKDMTEANKMLYYFFVHQSIGSLKQVLDTVDTSLLADIGAVPGLEDNTILAQISGTQTATTGTQAVQTATTGTQAVQTATTGTQAVQTATTENITRAGWMLVDTNCNISDIQVGSQIWAGCNSTLGDGTEYTGTASITDLGINTIGGKFYTWNNQNTACPTGWNVPSRADFQAAFVSLGCQSYNPGYATSVICPGLGWTGNGNTFPKALKLPLSGYKDIRFSASYLHRGRVTYLATSTLYEDDSTMRRSINIDKNWDKIDEYASPKTTEYSVRCIKNGTNVASNTTNTTTVPASKCATRPTNIGIDPNSFDDGNPIITPQSWQNTNPNNACYYKCKPNYSGVNCTTVTTSETTTTTQTTTNSNSLKCTRNGTEYLDGDVRCDGNKQIRCDGGTFKQIYTCNTGDICTENLERTTNGNFFTSCKREYDTYKTDGAYNYITISDTEKETLKENAQYRCKYNMTTRIYGSCTYQSCSSQAHEEGGKCVSNVRDCTIVNTNGGRQTWSNGTWGTCQATSNTTCATGYRMIDGTCKTGAETCNSSESNILTANGVDFSTKTYNGYPGGGVWNYDTTLADACTWKCKEGYIRTTQISGYRGKELCEVKVPVVKLTASKTKVNPGDTITLTWNATDMVNPGNSFPQSGCYFITDGSATTGVLTTHTAGVGFTMRPNSGSEQVTITKNMTFQMHCRATVFNDGARSEIINITVTPPPTLGLSIANGGGTGGDFIELQWHMSDALSCIVSGPGADVLGWTSAGPSIDYYQSKRFSFILPSIVNYLPGKKIILTCTGLGGKTSVETVYSKNNEYGSCVKGVYKKAGSIYPDIYSEFTIWLKAEYKKYGRNSLDIKTIQDWTQFWISKVNNQITDSTIKAEISTAIQSELTGDWNNCQ